MRPCLHNLVECGYQRLGQPEREDELGTCHQELRCQALEERSETLILHHVGNDSEAALGVFEVPVLYPGLDNV